MLSAVKFDVKNASWHFYLSVARNLPPKCSDDTKLKGGSS